MSVFEKHRFEVWNPTQHPYKHTLADFSYSNPVLPGVSNLETALNWILAVLYPNALAPVNTVGDLPALGNTINDYRVVFDDGDGKAAAYRWEQREGEVSPSWHKVYDMDWGESSILSGFLTKTQDVYVFRYGYDDLDETGTPIAGLYAGQTIYGGASANTNLTLKANAGDGTGPQTGFVQVADNFRPAVNNTFALGTATEAFTEGYFTTLLKSGTLSLASGLITDSSGAISFGNENLSTTGSFGANSITSTTTVTAGTLLLGSGSITDSSGSISFDNENLSTTGTLASGTHTISSDLTLAVGLITSLSGTISFDNENLITTGTLSAGDTDVTRLDVDNIRIDANTISVLDVNGDLHLVANGTGAIFADSPMFTSDITATGDVGVVGTLSIDNISLDANTITTTAGNLILNSFADIEVSKTIVPTTTSAQDIGAASKVFNDIYLDGSLSDGTLAIAVATILAFRDALVGAANGNTLFYDSVSGKFLPSTPDSEIDHTTISNLTTGDAGHTQFVMLAGRAGGQTVQGGTAASENLVLESTSNATKGSVQTKDNLTPFTNASYAGSWSGTDLGDTSHYFRDIYTKGEAKGLRLENYLSTGLPGSNAANVGRVVFATDNSKIYVDTGSQFVVAGVSKYAQDIAFNGSETVKNVDVSSKIQDARTALIQLLDNANDFERIYTVIKATSVSNVRIDTGAFPLPAGSYRLIVIE